MWINLIKALPALISLLKDALFVFEKYQVNQIEKLIKEKDEEIKKITDALNAERKKVQVNEEEIKKLHFKLRSAGLF